MELTITEQCIIEAAKEYRIAPTTLLAVAKQEGGKPQQWVKNSNGTHDVGVMQFNTDYLASLKIYGITPEHVSGSNCYPYRLAAWRIKMHIQNDQGSYWQKVANYHSKTPKYNEIYRYKIERHAQHFAKKFQKLNADIKSLNQRLVNLNPPKPSHSHLEQKNITNNVVSKLTKKQIILLAKSKK